MIITDTKGRQILLNKYDYEKVSKYHWHTFEYRGLWYATTSINGKTVYMHRLIMDAPDGTYVDHKNRNGLDNRRRNLRVTNQSTNIANAGMFSHNTSGYRGVVWFRGYWRAQLKFHKTIVQSGGYADPKLCALIRDEMARRLHGSTTFINLPKQRLEAPMLPVVDHLLELLEME